MTRHILLAGKRLHAAHNGQARTRRRSQVGVRSRPGPDVEYTVRKWLLQRLDVFYCELQLMYTPLFTSSMAHGDEAVEVNARGLNAQHLP